MSDTICTKKSQSMSTKRNFGLIVATTVKKYTRTIVSCIAMMVRFLNAKQSKDVQMLHSLGKFTLEASSNQLRCATDLRSCFIASKGKPDSVQLQQLMHAAFDSLLRPSNHLSGQFIACPTSQALLLLSLVGKGQYTTSQTLKSECTALQWTLQAILVHIVRLRYLHLERYSPDLTGTALLGQKAHHATVNEEQNRVSSVSSCTVTPSVTEGTTGIERAIDEEGYDDGYDDDTVPDDIEGEWRLRDIFSILDVGKYPVKFSRNVIA